MDPDTPVIVGAASVADRDRGAEPIDLMSRAGRAALDDSGAASLAARIGTVGVVWGVWPYRDPGRLVADRIGAPHARTVLTPTGGNQLYELVLDVADRIRRGELDAAVVCGAETMRTRRRDRAEGRRSPYLPEREGAAPDRLLGAERPLASAEEEAIGVDVPARFYAMAETAIRHRRREAVDDHRRRIAELWSRASAVAADNPDAWFRAPASATEIATESPSNRPVSSPYPKLMTSNVDVDQGGAVVICSAATADAAGVPRDRWVFPWSGAAAADHWHPTNRWAFDESPAMRAAGARALELAGLGVDDCGLLDLYSCFPAAVQVAQRELGIAEDRPFTITGGLTFAGGPLNCYCLLPLARAVQLLRDEPDQRALLTGNGGYFTKQCMVVLAGGPPDGGFRRDDVQATVDALPARPTPVATATDADLETYTVVYGRDGRPEWALLACLAGDGTRHWATSRERDELGALLDADRCGTRVRIDGGTARLV